MSKERELRLEKTGKYIRNGGIVAGLIGLFTAFELFIAGATLAASGEIFKRSVSKKRDGS